VRRPADIPAAFPQYFRVRGGHGVRFSDIGGHYSVHLDAVVGNAILATAYGLIWSGARNFDGKRISIVLTLAGVLIWLAACSIGPIYARPEARATAIDQKSGIVLRTMTTNTVAIAAMMKADPHRTSAKILRCWSHESNRRHPATPEVNTVMASNVGRSNTTMTDAI
jgi:hypothetical protein